MRTSFLGILTFLALSQSAFAVSWHVLSCWSGENDTEQVRNLKDCQRDVGEAQKCSANLWEHKHKAYDVCLMEATTPKKIIQSFPGLSQRQQNKNLKLCRNMENHKRVCIANAWTHGKGVYDVCLME